METKDKKREKLAVVEAPEASIVLNPQVLLQEAIAKGANIETLERLVALAKDVRAEQARASYYEAMAEFHAKCPPIRRTEQANIAGRYSYRFAPLDEINRVILPVMSAVGLSVSYRIKQDAGSVTAICRITQERGHYEESGEITMPITVMKDDRGNFVGANPAQCVGIAMSYAKRYALLALTGLAPEDDPDAEPANLKQPKEKEQPREAPISKEARAEAERGQMQATILKVEEKTSAKGVPFLRVTIEGNKTLQMWDQKQFSNLLALEGQMIHIEYEQDAKGYRTIKDYGILSG